MFRGTGGIIGEDYVSRVCQALGDLIEEVHPAFPATMGGLPVGAAGGINDPSMARGCDIAFEDAKQIFLKRYALDMNVRVVVGGYSAGAVAAALFREWLLKYYPRNYVCSFSFGDPTRPSGGAFFAGKPAPGHGISTWRYGDIKDYRHCWLSQPGDMYTSVPEGDTGLILGDFYDIITKVELSNVIGTFGAILEALPDLLVHAGILDGDRGRPDTSGLVELVSIASKLFPATPAKPGDPLGSLLANMSKAGIDPIGQLFRAVVGLLDGEPDGLAAAINAAIVAIKFVASQPPTGPHITYEFERPPGYGGTYLDLAIQHCRDWLTRP